MITISSQHSFAVEKGRRLLCAVALGLGLILALSWLLALSTLTALSVNSVEGLDAGALSPGIGAPSEAERFAGWAGRPASPGPPAADGATRERVGQALLSLPLRFVPNAGQTDPAVQFTVQGEGHTLFFTPQEVVFSAVEGPAVEDEGGMRQPQVAPRHAASRSVVRLTFLGANPAPAIEGLSQMPGVVNYMLGNDPAKWQFNVPTYEAVAYRDLYPGVDLIYRGTAGHLKSEFVLAPGADPSAIRMRYDGADGLHLRQDGALVLDTPLGELIETAPLVYQRVDGARQEIEGRYLLLGQTVGFQVSAYDPTLPLVIDPELAYSSYLGGSLNDEGHGIAVDGDGGVYVTGHTLSSDFPTTNAIQPGHGGGDSDAFVTHIIGAGGVYTYGYSTYLGGSDWDEGYGIAVDGDGGAYVTGDTKSSDFPTNAIQPGYGGGDGDAFVTRIVGAGGVYTYAISTYLGGSDWDNGRGIAVDGDGGVYVMGRTYSSDFPTTTNAIQPGYGGNGDAFVTHIVSAGGVYTYAVSTYLGGSSDEFGYGVAVDGDGAAYVTGYTYSSDFPTTTNSIQPGHGGYEDAFVTRIISAGGVYTYDYSTYLGGSDRDYGYSVAVDGDGGAYVTGRTQSSGFPTTNAIQPGYGGNSDAFVTHIISAGGVYTYAISTYLGGSEYDEGQGVAVDGDGVAYVAGWTYSSDFPTSTNAIQPDHGGSSDAFVTCIISAGGVYTYATSTYLGGSSSDGAYGVAVEGDGVAYVTGRAWSSNFPTTTNAIQPDHRGAYDAFVTRMTVTRNYIYLPLVLRQHQ